MAADPPLSRLVLSAASVADDIGYVALADLGHALGGVTADYRIIGGHMVTMLAARWRLGASLYRETGDVDLGVPPIVARDHNIVDRLKDLGYTQVAGNRFARRLFDVPIRLTGAENTQPEVFIDVLVPAYTSRARAGTAPDRTGPRRRVRGNAAGPGFARLTARSAGWYRGGEGARLRDRRSRCQA